MPAHVYNKVFLDEMPYIRKVLVVVWVPLHTLRIVSVLFSKWSRELRRCLSVYLYIYIYLSTYLSICIYAHVYVYVHYILNGKEVQ